MKGASWSLRPCQMCSHCTEGMSMSHSRGILPWGLSPGGSCPVTENPSTLLTSFPRQLPRQPVSRQKEEAKRRHSEATLPPRNHPEESIPGSRVLWVKHRSEHGGVEAAGLPFLHEQPGCIGATCCRSSHLPQGRREGLHASSHGSCPIVLREWPRCPQRLSLPRTLSPEQAPTPPLTGEEATSLGRPSEGRPPPPAAGGVLPMQSHGKGPRALVAHWLFSEAMAWMCPDSNEAAV